MTTCLETFRDKNIGRAREALERVRSLRRARQEFGTDGISRYVKDIDGDWLENWSESSSVSLNCEASESNTSRITPSNKFRANS